MPRAPIPSNLFPALTYADAAKAIEWLCTAFGFEARLVVPGADGRVEHSELQLGPGVIMVSSPKSEQGRVAPGDVKGSPQTMCVRVEDPDALFARATAAGAEVMFGLTDEDYGARGFMVKDLEGQVWYFSDYLPGAHWDEGGSDAN